jgi:fucose permease
VKRGLLLGLACVVVALGAMATAPVFLVFLVGLGARSLGAGVVRGVDKPVLSHLFPGRRDRLLNVYELTWAFGAAAAPLVATLATAYATWEAAYVLVALLVVPILALAVRAPLPVDALDEQPLSLAGIRELSGDARVRGMTVGLLLSGGIEGGLFLWLPTYLGEFVAPTTANLAFSAFFLTYIPARVFHTVYAPRVGYLRLLVGSGLGTAVLLAYGFALGDGLGIVVSLTLAGFFVAGLFPLLSAYGIAAVPERSGPVNGLSLGAGFAGSSLTPLAIGVLIERFSLRLGMQLLCAYAVVLVAVLVVMLAYERRAPDGV